MINCTRVRMARKSGEAIVNNDFTVETFQLPAALEGEVVCKARYISLDPYLAGMMRSWQGPERDWSEGIIVGRMVGEVIESKDPSLAVGDWVFGDSRWQNIEVKKAKYFEKIQLEEGIPASAYLGVLGSSGLTAWVGIHRVLNIQAGDTLTISSAAGTVGAIAGQLAKQRGAKVIGIAGGPKKCAQVINELKFDACVDHYSENLEADLAATVGDGMTAHFENVGAKILDPVLALIKDNGRIALCGLIAHYLDDKAITLRYFRNLLNKGLKLQGFRIFDHLDANEQAQAELRSSLKTGVITLRETITEGLENAPEAYIAMLTGDGTGKHLVHVKD